ncbi:MAG: molecular chaperone DnaK [Planctomycetota bacterium]|nr:MAG: molecular chaperone DnaK [Planctomycetota bacterium]
MVNRRTTTEAYRREDVPTGKVARTRYVVGIDLGTTNTALSYVDRRSGRKARTVRPFPIPQLVEPGLVAERATLPSALYLAGAHELSPEQLALPWDSTVAEGDVAGVLARKRGAKTPERLIASAKSWLCHPEVDRRAAILPWGAPEGLPRRSPVEVQAALLKHLRSAWDQAVAREDPSRALAQQDLVVTVPASFDEVARELTLEAIDRAGLHALLIEEPQAALYAWIAAHEDSWRDELRAGETILVCDVGGGTTDFSLIEVRETKDGLGFERTAVGDHLLLGGDNMDLTLARRVEDRLGAKLDLATWSALVQECRDAKERLLAGEAAEVPVAVQRRGRKLIGGTLRANIAREEATEVILEGFFPLVDREDTAPPGRRSGLSEFGLPFEADPAITRHLSAFLARHGEEGRRRVDRVLFNGGVFQTQALRERVLDAIGRWQERPRELAGADLDLAVARGAAYYGLVRRGKGTRIEGGVGRSYYLEVGAGRAERQALCLIPRGLAEGEVVTIDRHPLRLQANRPVVFPFHTATARKDPAGALVSLTEPGFDQLAPLHTVVRLGRRRGAKAREIPVELVARTTELGTVEMWVQTAEGEERIRWRLEVDTRARQPSTEPAQPDTTEGPGGEGDAPEAEQGPAGALVVSPERVDEARAVLREAFASSAAQGQRPLERLGRRLEEVLEVAREGWPVPVLRALCDELLTLADARKRSPHHEARWLNLAGWSLRPGFGTALDPHRVKQLWKVQLGGQEHRKASAVRLEWVVAFRRIAGGLNRGQQEILFAPYEKHLLGQKRGASRQELAEYWRLAGSLEHLSAKRKRRLGERLLELLERGEAPPRWGPWALGRLGGRAPLFGPLDRLVSAEVAARWLRRLLDLGALGPEAEFAYVQLARKTGDRARDVPEELRAETLARLEHLGAGPRTLRPLREVVRTEFRTQQAFYGDSVPMGLSLATPSD